MIVEKQVAFPAVLGDTPSVVLGSWPCMLAELCIVSLSLQCVYSRKK